MSLDSVVCQRTDCVFNQKLHKDRIVGSTNPIEPYIIDKTPECGVRGKPELDKEGKCTEFIKITDTFKPLLAWFGKQYTNNRHALIDLNHSQCWQCYRYGENKEAIKDGSIWCPSCHGQKA